MPHSLNVQLRLRRKETGLTQADIAHLLGFSVSSQVSRFERLVRDPDLRTAFGCEVVLGASASALFAPIFAEIAGAIGKRAIERLNALSSLASDPTHGRRLAYLAQLADKPRTLFDA